MKTNQEKNVIYYALYALEMISNTDEIYILFNL